MVVFLPFVSDVPCCVFDLSDACLGSNYTWNIHMCVNCARNNGSTTTFAVLYQIYFNNACVTSGLVDVVKRCSCNLLWGRVNHAIDSWSGPEFTASLAHHMSRVAVKQESLTKSKCLSAGRNCTYMQQGQLGQQPALSRTFVRSECWTNWNPRRNEWYYGIQTGWQWMSDEDEWDEGSNGDNYTVQ